jgi:hypothetical protein
MMKWVLHRTIDNVERDWNYDVSRMAGLLAAALVVGFVLATTVAAYGSGQPATVSNLAFTPKRIVASGSALVGLIGAVIGGLALARSAGPIGAGNGRRGAIVALVMGPIGLVIGGLVVATADGGLGTGNGIAGGVVAMIVGLFGIALGGLALIRSRRIA